jgi:CheY-like chemotaxis protein
VLLVEDDTVNQLFMMDLLQEMGHAPVLAATGREALDKLTQDGFDVVLMDIQMPGMDGAEATRRIRAGEAGQGHADVPIIGLSAYAIREEVERYKAAGLNAYLTKPVDQEELQETLMTYAFP